MRRVSPFAETVAIVATMIAVPAPKPSVHPCFASLFCQQKRTHAGSGFDCQRICNVI